MKTLVRNSAINAFALFLLPQMVAGVKISGGFPSLILAGFILALLHIFIKPILTLLSLPLTIVTFGMFSFFINVILLYLLTVLLPQITISAFIFNGFTFAGFVIPKISFNVFFAYVASSLVLSLIVGVIAWVIEK